MGQRQSPALEEREQQPRPRGGPATPRGGGWVERLPAPWGRGQPPAPLTALWGVCMSRVALHPGGSLMVGRSGPSRA